MFERIRRPSLHASSVADSTSLPHMDRRRLPTCILFLEQRQTAPVLPRLRISAFFPTTIKVNYTTWHYN